MKRIQKKGMTIGEAPGILLMFVLMILIAGSGAIALNGFKSTTCTYTYDSTNDRCLNSTGGTGADTGTTYAFNVTADGESGLDKFSNQVPTIGTILGVSLIIVVIVGAFAYMQFRNSGGF